MISVPVSRRQPGAYGFFTDSLETADPELAAAIDNETLRQQSQIDLIASENIVSRAVLEAQGSPLTNKYAEGYPGRRYYGGCASVDVIEILAISRAKQLFQCAYANVQPHSGAQANQAAFLAYLSPGDTILGMSLAAGGHLTHGARPSLSGKWFDAVAYGVRRDDALIDFDEVARLAESHRPKLIIAGGSAYPRIVDFARFRAIADAVGAGLLVDMAHFAGLVAGGVHPSPLPYADVVTTTTHKTLRGPRGGMILAADEAVGRRLDAAVFPGLQGGPLMHAIAAKAVALGEAAQPAFGSYARSVVENAKILAETLAQAGLAIVSGGTDTHLLLVDLRPLGLTGRDAEASLERAGIACNKNGIPFDPERPTVTSGIRLGSPAATTRGLGPAEFRTVGRLIVEVLSALARRPAATGAVEARVRDQVRELCAGFPIYPAERGRGHLDARER
jgi:glycine hydroxymethyltransferase